MIRPLRKRHLYTWLVLALLLPLGFFAAMTVIPKNVAKNQKLDYGNTEINGFTSKAVKSDHSDIVLNATKKEDGTLIQLTVDVKAPIASPAAFIYVSSMDEFDIETAFPVSALASKGKHFIPLDLPPSTEPPKSIFIYDKIKGNLIYSGKL